MAGSMKDIKLRIKSVESTMQITKAMELVASSKMRRAKERVEHSRPYFETLYKTLTEIAAADPRARNPYLRRSEIKRTLLVVIAGDRGLAGGYNSNVLKLAQQEPGDHLVLPIVTLVIVSIGSTMRYTRTNMLEVLNADYIRTARAKGLSEHVVIYKHAFRNTLIPLVTIIGGSLPGLFSGALITETLFSIPGIGYISYQSMVAGDIPFTMFYLSFMAVLTLVSNLLTDIMYAVVDPRVRIS